MKVTVRSRLVTQVMHSACKSVRGNQGASIQDVMSDPETQFQRFSVGAG